MVHNTSGRSSRTRLRGERPSEGSSRRPGQRVWLRLSGFGIELAGAVGGFCLLGYWIDRRYDTHPWGLLICAICGLIGGFYNFFRSSIKALTPPESPGSDTGDDSKQ